MALSEHPVEDSSSISPPDGAEETSAASEPQGEEFSTKRELRKILREDSNWSVKAISITALTGVSAAVISTQLNGLVSSMVLIAVMAFITASVSEIYRISLALTGLGAKRAAARAAKVLPIPLVDPKLREKVALESLDSDSSQEHPVTEAMEVIASAYRLSEEQEAKAPGLLKRLRYRLSNYGRANPFLWLVALFLAIAIATVTVAYMVTDGKPPQIIQRTVSITEEISPEDRETIVAEAKEQAVLELQPQPQQSTVTVTADPSQELLAELRGVSERLTAMELEMSSLRDDPAILPTPLEPDQELLDRIAKLETEREELTERIAELEEQVESMAPAPQATETPSSP